jgi:Zn-dependent protease
MNAFRLGRVFGIEIRVDSSWILIFVLMTWNLASGFTQWHPDWSAPERVVVAAVASLLFFACVLAHELAHSLVATRLGLGVRSITLFLFGGVSNIEHEPPSAGSEFATAVVGPLTSILLGVLFVALASALTPFSVHGGAEGEAMLTQLGPGATLLAWLGPVNIGVGIFNLIPAFPLDGGRVLRATLWGVSKDWKFATRAAAVVAQVVGWGFIVAGVAMSFGVTLPWLGRGVSSGLWLAFIGWWIHSAASQSFRRVALDDPGAHDGRSLA